MQPPTLLCDGDALFRMDQTERRRFMTKVVVSFDSLSSGLSVYGICFVSIALLR